MTPDASHSGCFCSFPWSLTTVECWDFRNMLKIQLHNVYLLTSFLQGEQANFSAYVRGPQMLEYTSMHKLLYYGSIYNQHVCNFA
jgi:hypothetical protein